VENVQECSKGIAGHFTDLGLVHQGLVEEVGSILLLRIFLIFLLAFGTLRLLLLHGSSWNVEAHFHKFISSRSSLATPVLCAASRLGIAVPIGGRERELHRDLVLSSQIGIRDFGVRDLEGGSVLHVKGQFGLGEFCFAPIPSSQGVFSGLDVDAVPDFESLAQSLEILDTGLVRRPSVHCILSVCAYLLVKTIQLDDTRRSRQDSQLVPFRCATPLGTTNVAAIQSESVPATRRAPSQTALSQLAFSRLL
jgi:hypothetical protein